MKDFTRLFDIIYFQQEKFPQNDSFAFKENGQWKHFSTQQMINTANAVSLSLLKLGVKPNDKIAIVSTSRPEWNAVDLGILQIGAINVPVYPTISEGEYKFIFNDAIKNTRRRMALEKERKKKKTADGHRSSSPS